MKLVKKSALRQIGTRLVDNDDEVVSLPQVADQANEVFEIMDLITFIEKNRKTIEASGSKPVVYTPEQADKPRFGPLPEIETPLRDAEVEKQKNLALEFLAHQNNEDVNQHLARYDALAAFIANDHVELTDGHASEFKGEVLDLTEDDVIDAVKAFHDPDMAKLRKKLVIRSA